MHRLALTLSSTLLLTLSACSAQQAPQAAVIQQSQPSHADLGSLRVHYNLLPTLAMNEAVARSYQVQREADRALLVVALRQLAQGEELPAEGKVQATATDLSGKRQQIELRAVRTGPYTDLIGVLDAHPRDQLRVDLQISAAAGNGKLRFERNF
ncbi:MULTISPECIES: DUF4426 domain-containing protein [Stenotrophomonas]|uniref:DUF4426 domain-containing protein n=1 Tax=Stenotrophomonas TaxID=40323 RepID=UPI00077063D8|nr:MULTISPECIES: DUF4426 domain-containing protein [Stenotrophomonas]AMJ57367.1 hypothetical protein AXG53_12470 [Stenotrophomonas sp. KCTC 12332]